MKYKQTQDDSDSDMDELQGMMHRINEADPEEEPSVRSAASIVNQLIGKTTDIQPSSPSLPGGGPDNVAKRIFALNRARSLKDSVKRQVSKSGIFGRQNKRDQVPNSKMSVHPQSDQMSSYSNPAHSVRSALSASGLSSLSPPQSSLRCNPNAVVGASAPSKSVAIHPALSSAIETVQEMSALKAESARHHGLVVSSTIMEADTESDSGSESLSESESESCPSGIDLSEEFIRIEDDVGIDVQDMHDLNDMAQRQRRPQSMSKRHQHQKYSSIGYIDDDDIESTESEDGDGEEELSQSQHRRADRVFGMMVQSEEKGKFRRGPKAKTPVSTDSEEEEESDNVSELSEEQTLQSIAAASFSQDI